MRCRVNIYDRGTNRGPGKLVGCIEDAAEVGFSENANWPGEGYFTLPYNHWAHAYLQEDDPDTPVRGPLNAHVEFQRQETSTSGWVTIGYHLLADYDSTAQDTVYYTQDYLSLFDTNITSLKTTFTAKGIAEIVQTIASVGIHGGYTTDIDPDSRLGFVSMGHIDTTSATTTVISDYQSRLMLMRQMMQIEQQGTSARPIISISRSSPFSFDYYTNKGQDRPELQLEYGTYVNDFHIRGDYGLVATQIRAIGQRLGGATVLYSTQSVIPSAKYGYIQKPIIYPVLPNQDSLDKLALSEAESSAQVDRDLLLIFRSRGGLGPYDGYDLGDSVPVTIHRGRTQLTRAYYTIWGIQWIGHGNGTETTSLIISPQVRGLSGLAGAGPPPLPKPVATPVQSKAPASGGRRSSGDRPAVTWQAPGREGTKLYHPIGTHINDAGW